ncbi:MAG: YqgE/AlgH family protein [Rhodothermales bacterium]|nr:YqgE/AlgH family protein [Rhodothermales bacterium]
MPILRDPNFYRSVVLVCDHNEEGTFGLVLNRETDVTPDQIMDELDPVGEPVRIGGPVQPNTLHYLHGLGEHIDDAIEVANGLWWGGDFEVFKEVVSNDGQGPARLFLGYSGWGEGQLEEEIEEGSWAVATMRADWAFEVGPDSLWREVMLSLGGDWALMANYPDDPRTN